MSYKSTRRQWVKLWVNEWLDGTTRFELTAPQRLLWVDLLALAGRSRYPGFVYAGEGEGGKRIGYPIAYLAGVLQMDEVALNNAMKLLKLHGHITLEEVGPEQYVIGIINWEKYQSEYLRQKTYRKVTTKTTSRLPVEGEGEVDVEEEGEVEEEESKIAAAFAALKSQPFGTKKFKGIWYEEWVRPEASGGTFADSMERTIHRCKRAKVTVPGRFFSLKHEIEKIEAANSYRRTPL